MLKIGDKAPHFEGVNQRGEQISLESYKGKKLILYFYPKDDTPGCTKEACNLRDNFGRLRELGFEILGVSADKEKKHQKFIDKYDLPFDLLADTEKETINTYESWGRKKFMGREFDGILRRTFVIDESGIIIQIIGKVVTKDHTQQILDSLEEELSM